MSAEAKHVGGLATLQALAQQPGRAVGRLRCFSGQRTERL